MISTQGLNKINLRRKFVHIWQPVQTVTSIKIVTSDKLNTGIAFPNLEFISNK